MKVIFLDIDGVLNCDRTPNPRKFPYVVDERLLRRFKALLKKTQARAFGIPFFGGCPDRPRARAKEDLLLLKRHPQVTCYAVID